MTSSVYVSRINQIDAAELDLEIYNVLRNQAKEITKYTPPGVIDKWQAEVDVVLKFLIWKYSLQRGSSTFGQRLLNLQYGNINEKKAVLYLILTVLPQYLRDKLSTVGSSDHVIVRKLKVLVDLTANVIGLVEIANLLVFLHRGIQPRVIELLLGLKTQSITTHRPRIIGYSYMTRELLWHGLMELFTVGLPMINFHYLKQIVMKLWRRNKPAIRRSFPVLDASTKCVYCGENPILPSHAGCEHIFCYYCLRAHFTAMRVFSCPGCNAELYAEDMKRYTIASTFSSDDEESDDSFVKVDDG